MDELDLGETIRGLAKGQQLFQRYVLEGIAGRGGMGVVWVAQDEKLDRRVALKFLPELVIHDAGLLDQMKRETRRSLELTHRNIVRIYDFVGDPDCACISMEYVDGPTLSALRVQRPNRVFEVDEIREWMTQACEALEYAHRQARIVHRDLKPANLMLNSKGELKIADFGIARSLTDSVSLLTQSRGASGTLVYMSPQQLVGDRASHLDDIYSLGASIYDLLTGRPPFYTGQIELQIRERLPATMTQRRKELEVENPKLIPAEWEEWVATCLSKDPGCRPQSAGELAVQLGLAKACYKQIQTPPREPTLAIAPRTDRNPRGPRWMVISTIAVLALLVGFLMAKWFLQMQRLRPRTSLQAPEPRPAASPSPVTATFSPTPVMTSRREPAVTPGPAPCPTIETFVSNQNQTRELVVTQFVGHWVAANQSKDIGATLTCFAPRVDYFDEGIRDQQYIRQDLERYAARWPIRKDTIDGRIQIEEKIAGLEYVARFKLNFSVNSATRRESIRGQFAIDLTIKFLDGTPRIVSIKEKVLSRTRGNF
jgi:serine/threonine protein kinase